MLSIYAVLRSSGNIDPVDAEDIDVYIRATTISQAFSA